MKWVSYITKLKMRHIREMKWKHNKLLSSETCVSPRCVPNSTMLQQPDLSSSWNIRRSIPKQSSLKPRSALAPPSESTIFKHRSHLEQQISFSKSCPDRMRMTFVQTHPAGMKKIFFLKRQQNTHVQAALQVRRRSSSDCKKNAKKTTTITVPCYKVLGKKMGQLVQSRCTILTLPG